MASQQRPLTWPREIETVVPGKLTLWVSLPHMRENKVVLPTFILPTMATAGLSGGQSESFLCGVFFHAICELYISGSENSRIAMRGLKMNRVCDHFLIRR